MDLANSQRPVIKELLKDPDNNRCFHCNTSPVELISTNNAIFICSQCARIHKKLGVEISSLSSIRSDLTLESVEIILLGGNRLFKEFLSEYNLSRRSIREKLMSRAADYYRAVLKATAENQLCLVEKPGYLEGMLPIEKPLFKMIRKARSISTKARDYILKHIDDFICHSRPSINITYSDMESCQTENKIFISPAKNYLTREAKKLTVEFSRQEVLDINLC